MRIAIITQNRVLREGLSEILSQAGFIVVSHIGLLKEDAIPELSANYFDAVLIDASSCNYLKLPERILEHLNAKVIAFGLSNDEDNKRACINAGYCGCVLMDHGTNELISTLHYAVFGIDYFSVAEVSTNSYNESELLSQINANHLRITKRETQILKLLGTGISNKQIANKLNIEVSTVKNHVHNLFDKLKVHRRGEAAALARQFRL